jgi:DNA-binding SARP family transcriptional activator
VDGERLSLGAGKQRALLALLSLNAGRAFPTDQLVDELWAEAPGTAHKMVQIYVSQLRKVLPAGVLETRAPGYRLAVEPDAVDSHRFERRLADGRRALAAGRPDEAASVLRDGLSLWQGEALAEFASEPFAEVEGDRLDELRLAALEERLEADLALGRHADLVGELDALVARHPLRERLRGQQMLALYRSGRQADALAAYHEARDVLDDELGIKPSAALRELERRILQQDEALVAPPVARGPSIPAGAPAVDRPPPLLVGRDAEFARLDEALTDAFAGRRRLVFVTGDAGLGKTALVEGLLAGRDGDLLVGRGRCVESNECAEAYLPVLDALSRLCRSAHGVDVIALLRLHAPTWLTQLPWLVEPDEIEQLERRVFGANRDRMRREMGEALDAISAFRPLVLVLEDLHWSDASTLDLLGWLAYRDDPARLLVIATYREQGDGTTGVGSVVRGLRIGRRALEVPLAPLDAPAVAEIVARRLPELELGEDVAARLVERTGGNPFFVETVLDAWIADGAPGRDNVSELVGRVPDTARALVERQLDELSEAERTMLEAASVVGGEISAAAVAAALERPVEEVEAELDALVHRGGSLRAAGSAEWPDGTVAASYRFVHELHEQVVYERLAARRRAVLHARVAACLEAAYGDRATEVARQLSSHYVRARAPERAVRFLTLAAEQSASRSAYPETIEHANAALEALAALPSSPQRDLLELELQTLLGQTLVTAWGWSDPGVESAFLRARALCEQLGDNEPLVPVLLTLGTLYEVRGEFDRAQQIVAECLEVVPDADTAADTQELLACSLFHQGAFTRALEHAEVGVTLLEEGRAEEDLLSSFGESAGIACYDWAALAFWFLGYPDRALARARQALALAERPERRHSLAAARATAAFVHQCRREPREARRMAERAMIAATERGYRYRLAMGSALSGWGRAHTGDAEAGIPLVRRGLELSRATGATMDDPYYLGLLAEACLAGARFDEGLDAVAEALDGLGEDGSFYEAELHRVRAALRLRSGDPAEEVEPILREALRVARLQHARSLELRAAVDLGRLLAARGDREGARALVEPIREAFTEGEDVPDLVAAAQLVASLGGEAKRPAHVGGDSAG